MGSRGFAVTHFARSIASARQSSIARPFGHFVTISMPTHAMAVLSARILRCASRRSYFACRSFARSMELGRILSTSVFFSIHHFEDSSHDFANASRSVSTSAAKFSSRFFTSHLQILLSSSRAAASRERSRSGVGQQSRS